MEKGRKGKLFRTPTLQAYWYEFSTNAPQALNPILSALLFESGCFAVINSWL